MLGKAYRIRETDDNESVSTNLIVYIPERICSDSRYWADKTTVWPTVSTACKRILGDFYDITRNNFWYYEGSSGDTQNPTTCGVKARNIATAYSGMRWYISETNYVRLNSVQYVASGGGYTDVYLLNYTFYSNNSALFSREVYLGKGGFTTLFPMYGDRWLVTSEGGAYHSSGNLSAILGMRIDYNPYSNGYSCTVFHESRLSNNDQTEYLAWLEGGSVVDLDDPYLNIDDSTPSGMPSGGGIPSGDSVSIPSLPSVSVADTGFVTLFNPTLAQVKNLASYMWGSLFDISTFKKIFADPMDCILGFNLLPVTIPNGNAENVIVGNISTGVSMTKAGSQWVEVDCGTVNIGTPYDNYLDYSPYTKYSIYLPYIGTVDLSADDCVGKDIHLVYHVDVLSCSCVAYLKCGDSVLYQFTGSCGYSIPLTSENFRSMISSIVSIAGSIAGVVASGGASAPLTIGAVANTANNVMGLKPDIHRSGAIGSSAGLMGIQTPYLILQFPNPCKPSQQYKFMGYPSFVTVTVGDLSGYTEFDSIILDELTCDEDEKQLIEDILKGGVFL